jgi:arylsulfatase A-like enzyme
VKAAVLAIAIAVSLAGCGGGDDDGAGTEPTTTGRPNLIVVMSDDQTLASFTRRTMPRTWDLFHDDRSAIFTQAVASPPLCCPARAGFITGQYPHNHGVLGNVPGYADLRDKPNVLPAWLDEAGYRTAMVGKYLNAYEAVGGTNPAPGWDSWHAVYLYPGYFEYVMNDEGRLSELGSAPSDYATAALTDRAVDEIAGARGRPLFAWLAYNAPHIATSRSEPCSGELPEPPTPEAYERFADTPLPRDPSFDEGDRSDKPRSLADRSPLSDRAIEEMTLRWRCGLAALRALDGAIGRLVDTLEGEGELEKTVLVFTSDNGYFFGSHALDDDKRLPYAQSARVPLAIRVGSKVAGERPPSELGQVVSNVDLAPTLLDYAGTQPCLRHSPCRAVDGRSLRPLLEGDDADWPEDRAVLMELDEAYAYRALRTPRYLYSELTRDRAGELPKPAVELYDLERDPYELDNLWQTDRGSVRSLAAAMRARLDRLAACEGSEERRFRGAGTGDCE